MQISYNGLELIKEYEGYKATAYKDTGGVWTIGYGTTVIDGIPVAEGMTITEEKALLCLQSDVTWAQTAVNQLVRVPLNQNQFDSLVSFVYNEGVTHFYTSTLRKLLNQGNYVGAENEFKKWVYDDGKVVQGLINRRQKEQQLFDK